MHPGKVLLEHRRMSEVLSTDGAVESLLSGVDLAVPGQHGEPREPLVTDGALERTLSTVDHLQHHTPTNPSPSPFISFKKYNNTGKSNDT